MRKHTHTQTQEDTNAEALNVHMHEVCVPSLSATHELAGRLAD